MSQSDDNSTTTDLQSGNSQPMFLPLLPVALALLLGIMLGRHLPLNDWHWILMALPPAAALGLLALLPRPRLPNESAAALLRTFAACGMAIGVGAAVMAAWLAPAADNIAHLADHHQQRIVQVEGVLLESPRPLRRPENPLLLSFGGGADSTSMTLAVKSLRLTGGRRPVSGRIRLIINQPLPRRPDDAPRTGDRIVASALLSLPSGPLNPGQADMPEANRLAGISATATAPDWQTVSWQRPPWWSVYGWMGTIRHRWQRAFTSASGSAAGDLLPALVLGDRAALSDADQQAFARSGVMHYLAVSGLHVALAAAMLIVLLRRTMIGPRWRALLVIAFVICYCLATELRPSVLRASVFLILLSLGWLSGRRTSMLNTLAAAAIVVLLIRPADLFQPGFQLSFVVVLGLILMATRLRLWMFGQRQWEQYADAGPLRRWLTDARGYAEAFIAVSLTAWLFSAPLLAHHFAQLTPIGLPATLLVFPLTMTLLAVGLLTVLVSQIYLPAAQLLVALADYPAQLLLALVRLLPRLPLAHSPVQQFQWPWVVISLMLLIGWAGRHRIMLSRRRLGAAVGLSLVAFLWLGLPAGPQDEVRVTVLAVGNGDTVLVQGPGGYNLLIDCGSSMFAQRTADNITLPALRRLGVRKLDAVVLTHADADHVKDLPPVVRQIPTGRIYISPHFVTDIKRYDDQVLAWLAAENLPVSTISAGEHLPAPDGLTISVLYPPRKALTQQDSNEVSMVLHLQWKDGGAMLLPGDAPGSVLKQLTDASYRADILMLPHHGEQGPQTAAAVADIGAGQAIISAARQRDLGRPGRHRWPPGLRIYRTWRDGAITVHLDSAGCRVQGFVTPPPALQP